MDPYPDLIPDTDIEDFDPALILAEVPADQRADGWTGERRDAFLQALWNGASVTEAARSVGMTPQTARRLRHKAPAFRASWDDAQALAIAVLAETAFDRAMHGSQREVFHRGKMIGSRTVQHDGLLMRLLAVRDPEAFAPIGERERWARMRCSAADPAPAQGE